VSEQHDQHVRAWRHEQYDEHAREPSQVLTSPRRRVTVLRRHHPEELGSELNLFAKGKVVDDALTNYAREYQLRDRGRTDDATEKTLAKSRLVDDAILEVAESIIRKYPTRTLTNWYIAGEGLKQIHELLKQRDLKPLGRRAISERIEKLRAAGRLPSSQA
jgi:hypothetical protein